MFTRLTKKREMKNETVHVVRNKIDGKYDMHCHEFFEMEYIVSGKGVYTVNGTAYSIKPGMLFFMTPADYHSVAVEDGESVVVHFSENISNAKMVLELTETHESAAILLAEHDRRLAESLMQELLKEKEDTEYRLRLTECLVSKVAKLLGKQAEKQHGTTLSRKAMLYILNHFRETITLETIAEEVGVTPVYLSSVFKKETGQNVKEYVDSLRFQCAENLLCHSEFTVQEIAAESGFVSYSNFIRRFRQRYGVSPGTYKKSKQA